MVNFVLGEIAFFQFKILEKLSFFGFLSVISTYFCWFAGRGGWVTKFQLEKISKKITWHLYQKSQKNPQKTLWKGGSAFANVTSVQILHKKKLQNFKKIFSFLSILCYKDVNIKHPKGDLGINGNLLIECVRKYLKILKCSYL